MESINKALEKLTIIPSNINDLISNNKYRKNKNIVTYRSKLLDCNFNILGCFVVASIAIKCNNSNVLSFFG